MFFFTKVLSLAHSASFILHTFILFQNFSHLLTKNAQIIPLASRVSSIICVSTGPLSLSNSLNVTDLERSALTTDNTILFQKYDTASALEVLNVSSHTLSAPP